MFNTLMYAKKLEVEGDLATKQDVKELKQEMQQLEYRLIIKLTAAMVVVVTIAVSVLTYLTK